MTLYEVEKQAILAALTLNKGNKTHTARYLDIGLRTLQRKLIDYATVIPLVINPPEVDVATGF